MFDHLSNDGAYSEADAARLVFEIASALAFLHGVGVIHADLKPENLLLCSRNRRGGTIKIIDFGCSRLNSELSPSKLEEGDRETGTTGYWPPERFQSKTILTPAVDMWALGIILYIMLTGIHPFDIDCDRTNQEIAEAIKADPNPPMDDFYVGHLSESVVDLMKKLMEPDPTRRITAYELLHHPWVRGETASTEKIEDSDKKLSQFLDLQDKLEASVFALLVNQGHKDMTMSEAKHRNSSEERQGGDVPIMKLVFDVLDGENKGYITGSDIGRLVTAHTGEVLNAKHTNDLLMRSSKNEKLGSRSEAQVSLSDFSNLFSGLKVRHYPRGHYLFSAGDEGSTMYFLSSGKVEIQTRKGQLVALLRRGDFFGEGSLLDSKQTRFTSARCATPVDVIEISREDFDRYTKTSAETRNDLRRKWRARNLFYAKNLLRLQRNVKIKTLQKGDVVYNEGEIGTSMFRVDDTHGGKVLVWKKYPFVELSFSHHMGFAGELEVLHGGTVVHKYGPGDSFGESSLLFSKPRSSTVRCISESCLIHEMRGEDFMAVVDSSEGTAAALRNMCRKRLFKKAVKQFSLHKNRGLSDDDIVAAFHDADLDKVTYEYSVIVGGFTRFNLISTFCSCQSGTLNVEEVRLLMHRMDPKFPMSEIEELMKFVDVDEDGQVSLAEFKRIFRQFEDEKRQ